MNILISQNTPVGRSQAATSAGQSLIEAIIALAILSTAVAAALTLTVASLNAQTDNEGYMVATNLAREGVEVVRNIRDSNWLANDSGVLDDVVNWDDGLYGSGDDYSAIAVFDRVSGDWTLNFAPAILGELNTRIWRYTTSPVGIFTQAVNRPNGTVPDRYFRLIMLQPVCRDGAVMAEGTHCDELANPKVGIRIRSRVSWFGGGRNRVAEIEETMYDWR